jgi:xanthine/uracil permease
MMFISSSNELGAFESGLAARFLGTVPAVVFGGCMTVLIVIVTFFGVPTLRKVQLNDKNDE